MKHLGVDFVSLHEQIDTSSPMGKAMFTIVSAISEFEREIIRERVRSGLARARAQGKRLGRPPVPPHKSEAIRKLRAEKHSIRDIAKVTGISKSAVAKVLSQA